MSRARAWWPRSLRTRLTILFAAATALAVGLTSTAIYLVLSRRADQAIDDGLSARAVTITDTLGSGQPSIGDDEPFALVLDAHGQVVTASPNIVTPDAVLRPGELAAALTRTIIVDRSVTGLGSDARLLAKADDVNGTTFVVVVGVDQGPVHASTSRLIAVLAVAALVLICLIAAGAWIVVGAALRPVHLLTQEADDISRLDVRRRLPEPKATDEIGELARTLNAMLERLAVSFDRERAFVDDASHELRTPLAVLQGELELAITGPPDPGAQRAAMVSALEEAQRLTRLADDLLVLSRADSDQLPLRSEAVDVVALTQTVAERLRSGRPDRILTVTGAGIAATDPDRLDQITTNLLTNALRWARSRVQVHVDHQGDRVEIHVEDDGPGFPEQFLGVAFDRFTQADSARSRYHGTGSGLGLAIVAALARALGGTVRATNDGPSGGAAVVVSVPAQAVPAQAVPAAR